MRGPRDVRIPRARRRHGERERRRDPATIGDAACRDHGNGNRIHHLGNQRQRREAAQNLCNSFKALSGFAHGVGMALAAKMTASQFGGSGDDRDRPGQHFVYGFVGDGCLMEGIASEAASFAGAHGLGNLVYVYDDNAITIDGGTDITFGESVPARFEAYGWHVIDSVDGQDRGGFAQALEAARAETDRPTLIVLKTLIGRGAPNFEGRNKAHGGPLGEDETRLAKEGLGWPSDGDLLVPDDVRSYCAERGKAKRAEREASDARLAAWRDANGDAAVARGELYVKSPHSDTTDPFSASSP